MKLGAHAHYLGAWNALSAVQLRDAGAWRPLREDERDGFSATDGADAVVLTLPRWLGTELAAIPWAGDAPDDAAREAERVQFAQYGERVVAFFRFAGVALPEKCEARLVATTEHVGTPRASHDGAVVIANVGSASLRLALDARVGVVLPPGEACVVRANAARIEIALAEPDAEFGLHLELAS